MREGVHPVELFTPDDVQYVLTIVDAVGREQSNCISATEISIEELDLESLVTSLHGITDPIGQLKQWLYDRFKELSSWFASTVETIVRDFWNYTVMPFIDAVRSTIDAIWNYIQQVPNTVYDLVTYIKVQLDYLWRSIQSGIIEPLTQGLRNLIDTLTLGIDMVTKFFTETLPTYIAEIPKMIQDVASNIWSFIESTLVKPLSEALGRFVDMVSLGLDMVARFFTETLPSYIAEIPRAIEEVSRSAWRFIEDNILKPLSTAMYTLVETVSTAIDIATKFFTEEFPRLIEGIPRALEELVSKAWRSIEGNLIEPLTKAIASIQTSLTDLANVIPSIAKQITDIARTVWSSIQREILTPLTNAAYMLVESIRVGLETIERFLTEALPRRIEEVGKLLSELPTKVFEALKVAGMTIWDYISMLASEVEKGFRAVSDTLLEVSKHLRQVGAVLTGFTNAVLQLPEKLRAVFGDILRDLAKSFEALASVIAEPARMVLAVAQQVWGALQIFIDWIVRSLQTIAEALISAATAAWGALTGAISSAAQQVLAISEKIAQATREAVTSLISRILIDPLKSMVSRVRDIWFGVLGARSPSEISLMFDIAWQFLWEYWKATVMVYLVSSIPRTLGDAVINIEPEAVGSKALGLRWRVRLSELATALTQGLRDFYPAFLTGTFVGIGSTLMRPVEYAYRARFVANYENVIPRMYSDVLKEEIERGAVINAFVETPGISEIREWIRRHLPLTKGLRERKVLDSLIATMRAHMKLYGLPKWYIDFLSDVGEKLYIEFIDRFGVKRKMLLSTIFELPTHSEMARMTQRDVFPGVDVMKSLGWVRGWNEDLTTMIYLLTFKYPSFERLWKFYMRATAGMLWFSPPDTIKKVFSKEAEEVGAGKPITPLELQSKITSPQHFKAFELALNTYFKWLEYSNFSWFTEKTQMYGIRIGEEIYRALGGWTADSWIMADTAADIPTKIDMRWMSRYGIILWLRDKLEKAGITFESYAPLVKVIPRVLEDRATSTIQVSLKWFSKLIQATGLHPAWVPIVTVAENIMAISDEMTLLRTGWLNLFKEGMLKVDDVERYLAGIITVSYEVGYWDPEAKSWASKWINLPVRWLPHERRLLALRMTMDRILDLYREFERYVASGVRTLAITAEKALEMIRKSIEILNTHYKNLTKSITGTEMTIALDEEYERIRLELMKMAQTIEVKERLRYWWYRVAGWLFYRIAYAYVRIEDIDNLLSSVRNVIPLFDEEIRGYREIARAILGIVRREYVPTPSQIATLAEIIAIDRALIEKALEIRQVPEEWRPIWLEYIEKKPLRDEFNRLVSSYYRAKRYGVSIPREIEQRIEEWFRYFRLTDREKELRELATYLEVLVLEAREYLPTPTMLATISEYVVIPTDLVTKALEARRVPKEWMDIWLEYIRVRPIKSDYKSLLLVAVRAFKYGAITEAEFNNYLKRAKEFGFRDIEIEILRERASLEALIEMVREERREYIPTPSMLATMSEYIPIPRDLIERVFEARRVPPEWRSIWLKYIETRPLSDDVRYLLSAYLRAKRYGATIPEDVERSVRELLTRYGVTETELAIRELAVALELMIETVPSLGALASMAEYIEIPMDYIKRVLQLRRVEKVYADLWIRYIEARTISREVNMVVSTFRRIYEYFTVNAEIEKRVIDLMLRGGWKQIELEIFKFDLQLRKAYRIMQYLIPTIRQFASDARYLPEWEQLFDDLLKARGIDVTRFRKQIEYYKKLIRNRMVWRQIAWYRTQVVRAYAYGAISRDEMRRRLEKLKDYGLSDREIELIMDGAELYKAARQAMR